MPTVEHIWQRVSKRLQSRLSPNEYRTWFSQAKLKGMESDLATVSVPNRFHASWIAEKYLPQLEDSLAEVLKRAPKVGFFYEQGPPRQEKEGDENHSGAGLNPALNFRDLQTGEWNRFATSSAIRAAEKGSNGYNPMYLFSKPGLGKTHLLHAIGNRIVAERPGTSVMCVDGPAFVSECSRCLINDQQPTVSDAEVLLFDDVHLLSGRPEAQGLLVQVFDFLHSLDRKVVFTGDRPPQELTGFDELLISRLGWGLIAEIQRPDPNAFLQIVRGQVRKRGIHLPEEVIRYLAQASRDLKTLERNIRRLEAYSAMKGMQIGLPIASSLVKGSDSSRIGIEDIKSITAGYFNIPVKDLSASGKKRSHAYPRQVAMYLARKYTDLSYQEIGTCFGRKDHSTVIHSIRKIEEQRVERAISEDLTRIENLLS